MDENSIEYKIKQKLKMDWSKIKDNYDDFIDACAISDEVLEKLKDEAEDFVNAFWLGVIFGESGRAEALNQGGDPEPEANGFKFGLTCRKLMLSYAIKQLGPQLAEIFGVIGDD